MKEEPLGKSMKRGEVLGGVRMGEQRLEQLKGAGVR
jgi:hypothetical protein